MTAPAPLRAIRAAFVFLTRVPLGGFPYSNDDWAWSSAHFPLVGALLGALLGVVDRALLPLGALAAAIITIALSMLLTGAFHEDGLADTSDALGGAYDREKVVAILKDSRIGTFGGAALVVSIALRASLAARLGEDVAWGWALVGCAARTGPVALLAAMPYATVGEQAKSRLVTRGRWPQAAVAMTWLAIVAGALVAAKCVTLARVGILALAMIGVAIVTGWRFARRLGGVTGDFLGATEQIGEMVGLAVLAWGAP
jgi:adenosylcobinamide-GDP ribazoletransferase